MGWFRKFTKGVGEVTTLIAGCYVGKIVETTYEVAAFGQKVAGDSKGAARTKKAGRRQFDKISNSFSEVGGSIGGAIGDLVEGPAKLAFGGEPSRYPQKRRKALKEIVMYSLTNAGASAIPTPGLETHKHVALGVAEVVLCLRIAYIYFERQFTEGDIKTFLVESGLATGTGGGLAFVATKVGHGLINEALNFVPVVGPGIKATIGGSLTFSLGLAFVAACENRLNERRSLKA